MRKKITYLIAFFAVINVTVLNAQLTVASDNAGNYSTWANGNNLGFGFGAWDIWKNYSGGVFLASSSGQGFGDINTSSKAFGMWGNPSGSNEANAQRTFASNVWGDGATFTIQLATAYRNGFKGIDLFATGWDKVWNFNVGGNKYTAGGVDQTGWSYSQTSVFTLSVTQNGNNLDISLTRGSDSYSTTINNKTLSAFKLYVGSTDGGNLNNLFFNNLKVSYSDWSKVPTTVRVDVEQNSTLNANKSISDLRINNGINLNVSPGNQLTVSSAFTNSGTLTLQSSESGTATILTPASISGSGTYNVEQYITSGRNWYLSSPVSNATSSALSSANSISWWNETVGDWNTFDVESSLVVGRGYISVGTVSTGNITFSGSINNGAVPITLTRSTGQNKEGFNLVGNPYPSHITWTEALATAANTLTTIWYRAKPSGYTFPTYNASGNIGTLGGTATISPMQGFWVRVNAGGGTLTFNNSDRSHQNSNPLRAPASSSNSILRLEVSNGVNADEAVLYFNNNASDNFDAYDSPKMFSNTDAVPEIYTRAGNEQLVINGLSQYYPGLQLPLGFVTGQANSFSLRASEIRSIDADIRVILFDKQLNTEFDLTAGDAYNFSSDAVNAEERFAVLFKSASGTTDCCDITASGMNVYSNQGRITLSCNADIAPNARFSVYNSSGQLVHVQTITGYQTTTSRNFDAGVYVLKVENGNRTVALRTIVN